MKVGSMIKKVKAKHMSIARKSLFIVTSDHYELPTKKLQASKSKGVTFVAESLRSR